MSAETASKSMVFRSSLDVSYREKLEDIFYFNSNQEAVKEALEHAIDVFGIPRIVEASGRLSFRLEGDFETQTLFALENISGREQLVGVMIYTRFSTDTVSLIHLAVADPEDVGYEFDKNRLIAVLFDHMRSIAGKVKDVKRLHFFYGKKNQYVKVRK